MPDPKAAAKTIEFVQDGFTPLALILALAVGLVIGAAALYLFTEHVPEGERNA